MGWKEVGAKMVRIKVSSTRVELIDVKAPTQVPAGTKEIEASVTIYAQKGARIKINITFMDEVTRRYISRDFEYTINADNFYTFKYRIDASAIGGFVEGHTYVLTVHLYRWV